jgi:hypothetical protein
MMMNKNGFIHIKKDTFFSIENSVCFSQFLNKRHTLLPFSGNHIEASAYRTDCMAMAADFYHIHTVILVHHNRYSSGPMRQRAS